MKIHYRYSDISSLWFPIAVIIVGICLLLLTPAIPKELPVKKAVNTTIELPNMQQLVHNVGAFAMTMTNWGQLGNDDWAIGIKDFPGVEYPINSELYYLNEIALWVGGIKADDTLVSAAWGPMAYLNPEFFPGYGEAGAIIVRSSLRSHDKYDKNAVSEQDFICEYTDTVGIAREDPYDNRPHIPLMVGVRQSSYAWSYDYAARSILIDFQITNLDTIVISEMYIGFAARGGVYHLSNVILGRYDDINGFLESAPTSGSCHEVDTLRLAWTADNDGDPDEASQWNFASPRDIGGIRVLRPEPGDSLTLNYNWWYTSNDPSLSFGPRRTDPFVHFPRDLAGPYGDRTRYYVLSHPSIDYDQMFTAVNHVADGFLPPPGHTQAFDIADGRMVYYLLSIGPFDLQPGDTLPITLAYVVGDNFHIRPNDFANYFNPQNPSAYYDELDFSDLVNNSIWTDFIFDNPGYDTDGDGFAGRFMWRCNCDGSSFCLDESIELPDSLVGCCAKEYYKGDGVPDFRPAAPPPSPVVRTISQTGKVTLRWNGKDSEEYIDFLTQEPGFEGYRVYMARDDRLSDFVLVASYDLDDFMVLRYNSVDHTWKGVSLGITRDSLQKLYGSGFDPDEYYDQFNYFLDPHTGDILYFKPQDWNQSDLSNPLGIHKIYPNASRDDNADVTVEGNLRYYEYEYTFDNLQPSVPYYFAVTAFNRGSFHRSLHILESSPLINAVEEYALPGTDTVEHKGLNVVVYPNPYRISDRYARAGYENRDRSRSAQWARRIHFANLPRICTIRIFTVDGDLIREIKHYYPEGGPASQHAEWNIISRNTQAITTGIYIWSVRSEMGEQLGKLVIIK